MGCDNTKEKIEDQMMKIKMARIELQMERMNQLELLKKIDGHQFKAPSIPDYIDKKFLENYFSKMANSTINNNEETLRKKSSQQIRSKSILLKRNSKLFNIEEKEKRQIKRKKSFKRKTLKV